MLASLSRVFLSRERKGLARLAVVRGVGAVVLCGAASALPLAGNRRAVGGCPSEDPGLFDQRPLPILQ